MVFAGVFGGLFSSDTLCGDNTKVANANITLNNVDNLFWGRVPDSNTGGLGEFGNLRVAFTPDGDNSGNDRTASSINNGDQRTWFHSTWGTGANAVNRRNDSLFAMARNNNNAGTGINSHIAANNAILLLNTNFDKIIVDLGRVGWVSGIGYRPRSTAGTGGDTITNAEIWVMDSSIAGDVTASAEHMLYTNFHLSSPSPHWRNHAQTGTAWNPTGNQEKTLHFAPVQTRYVALRVRALSGTQITCSNLRIFGQAPGNGLVNTAETNNGTNDARRINGTNDGFLVNFNGNNSNTVGIMNEPANYDSYERQNNAGIAWARHDNSKTSNTGWGTWTAASATQVWVNISGDLRAALANNIISDLSFDIAHGLGVEANWTRGVTNSGSHRNQGTETYIDFNYNLDRTPRRYPSAGDDRSASPSRALNNNKPAGLYLVINTECRART
jgi:hypothetical protein